ncbi:MAG: zf-HC2 domain-containing protein [Candidatus Sulfotelmatobacter sp.]
MDHELVARQGMTERYLLGELDADGRHEFEEHFFDCPECALDVRAGALFVEQSKVLLADESRLASVSRGAPTLVPARPHWLAALLGMFKPAFAVPVMAVLLTVIGYQNMVTYPHLKSALNSPRVLAFASVNVGSWGAGDQTIFIRPGEGFLLFARIPADGYPRHVAELYNPAGKLEWSLPIPVSAPDTSLRQDQFPLQVPGAQREAGIYTLAVRGFTAAGESKEVGRGSFELQFRNDTGDK